jgi:hypothetical protein
MRISFFLFSLVILSTAEAQVKQVPYTETFDSIVAPALPQGWSSTTNKSSSGDFTTTTSSPLSSPNAVVSTNATISQSLVTPPLDFSGKEADSVSFYERRSSTHTSGVLVEASTDGGSTFPISIGDTLKNPGSTSYVLRKMKLPSSLSNLPDVRVRWRIIGNGSGTTGTFRLDDITFTERVQLDATIRSSTFSPPIPHAGDTVTVLATVINAGLLPIQNITVDFFNDINEDSIPGPSELFSSQTISENLSPGDSVIVTSSLRDLSSGDHRIIVTSNLIGDQHKENDTLSTILSVGFAKQSIVINEIMYEPLTGDAEYVELYNPGTSAIDLRAWRISDIRDTSTKSTTHVLSRSSYLVEGKAFVVVALDTSIFARFPYLRDSTLYPVIVKRSSFSLNNDGDNILLTDLTGAAIDSVHYFPSWHNSQLDDVSGRSLERISPSLSSNDKRNWSTSANPLGGTPGKENSIFTQSLPTATELSFTPNPFSPDGDGFEDVTIVQYHVPSASGVIRIRIYDANGRLVRTLANGEPTGSHGEIIWDGMNDNLEKVRMGIYVVLLEALDSSGSNVQTIKGVVVVAAKM